jgi:pantetheine-phosphate adenylyltransferase
MNHIALYPGSFDPVTNGHADIVRRSLKFADRLVVAVAANGNKSPLFSIDERVRMLEVVFGDEPRVTVQSFDGLLVDFAASIGAGLVVRGLRAVSDFEFEFQLALMNRRLSPEIESVFLMPDQHFTYLSSSIIREVARLGGDVSEFVHPAVLEALLAKRGA